MRSVHVAGLRELDAMLGDLPKATAKGVLRRVGLKALQPVAAAANAAAPDDPNTPGGLSTSFVVGTKLTPRQARLARKQEGKSFVEVYAGTSDPAGVQQEFGNVNHGPQPALRPAWDSEKDGVLDAVGKDLGAEITATVARRANRAARN